LLLEYSLGKERSYLWAVTPTDITAYELPNRAEIERAARNVYGLLTARNQFVRFERPKEREARIEKADADYFQAAALLSQIILGPVVPTMKGKHLLIVADGALQYLPFPALPNPSTGNSKSIDGMMDEAYQPLTVEHEITSLPSISVLGLLRREVADRKRAPKVAAVLADAVFSNSDERVMASRST